MVQGKKALVHRLHTELVLSHLHLGVKLVNLVITNQGTNCSIRHHDLKSQSPAFAVQTWQQRLRHDTFQNERELRTHLLLLIRRENVDDSVDRLHATIGVQRGKAEVTGLGNGQCRFDCFQITQLAQQDNVRVLTEDVFQGILKRMGV